MADLQGELHATPTTMFVLPFAVASVAAVLLLFGPFIVVRRLLTRDVRDPPKLSMRRVPE